MRVSGEYVPDKFLPLVAQALKLLVSVRMQRHEPLPRAACEFIEEFAQHAADAAVTSADGSRISADGNGTGAEKLHTVNLLPTEELSVEQAAEQLGCTARNIRQQLQAGKLRGHKVGGVWLVDPTDIERKRRRTA